MQAVDRCQHGQLGQKERCGEMVDEAAASGGFTVDVKAVGGKKERAANFREEGELPVASHVLALKGVGDEHGEVPVLRAVERDGIDFLGEGRFKDADPVGFEEGQAVVNDGGADIAVGAHCKGQLTRTSFAPGDGERERKGGGHECEGALLKSDGGSRNLRQLPQSQVHLSGLHGA